MAKQIVQLSDEALDVYDFFRFTEYALKQGGAAFVSGAVPQIRIFSLANSGQHYFRALCVAPMLDHPRDQMVPPREILHQKGYFVDYAQAVPPLNVPAEIGCLFLHAETAEGLEQYLIELLPRVEPHGLVWVEGKGASPDVVAAFAEPGVSISPTRTGNAFYWTKTGTPLAPEAPVFSESDFVLLCYPCAPGGKFRMMCEKYGYQISNDPTQSFDFAMKWIGDTFTPNDIVLKELDAAIGLPNIGVEDISKTFVGNVHWETLQYGLEVDPTQFEGYAVKKANLNAQCRESVELCPLEKADHGFIYQRLVVTPTEPDEYEEYRVAIMKDEIPYVVVKRRPLSHRFNRSAGYAIIREGDEVFNAEEKALIFKICERFGFQYGDLDILRDQNDGQIYIIDLNPTPGGPGGGYEQHQRDDIVDRVHRAFQRKFWNKA